MRTGKWERNLRQAEEQLQKQISLSLLDYQEIIIPFIRMKNLPRKPFGTRVAHGFLVHSISIGLINQTTFFDGTVMAQKGHKNIVFTKGVVAGDTVYAKVKVAGKNDMGKPDRGELVFDVEIINQKNEVCSKSTRTLLIKRRNQTH